jgi:hypothetical protein
VITEFAKNRRCVAAAKIVLRSVGVSPSRNCDLGPRDTAANRDAVIGGSPSLCRIRENLKRRRELNLNFSRGHPKRMRDPTPRYRAAIHRPRVALANTTLHVFRRRLSQHGDQWLRSRRHGRFAITHHLSGIDFLAIKFLVYVVVGLHRSTSQGSTCK